MNRCLSPIPAVHRDVSRKYVPYRDGKRGNISRFVRPDGVRWLTLDPISAP